MIKIQLLSLNESDCFACFKYLSEKIGFGHSVTCNNFFYTNEDTLNIMHMESLQIFIGNSYTVDGQLLCAIVNLHNATQGIVVVVFIFC